MRDYQGNPPELQHSVSGHCGTGSFQLNTRAVRGTLEALLPWAIMVAVVVLNVRIRAASKAVEIARSKTLHVHDTDLPLRELVLTWNPRENRLIVGGDTRDFLVAEDNAKWKGRKTGRDRFFVTARWNSNVYEFNVDSRTHEVTPANELAERLFQLPDATWKPTSPLRFFHPRGEANE